MITPKDIETAYKNETGNDHSCWDNEICKFLPTTEYTSWLFEKVQTYFNLLEDLKTISKPEKENE